MFVSLPIRPLFVRVLERVRVFCDSVLEPVQDEPVEEVEAASSSAPAPVIRVHPLGCVDEQDLELAARFAKWFHTEYPAREGFENHAVYFHLDLEWSVWREADVIYVAAPAWFDQAGAEADEAEAQRFFEGE